VCLIAVQMKLFVWVFAYLSHSFSTVIEQTAAGNDVVNWPDEPIIDWFLKSFYLGWLIAMCVAPLHLILMLSNVSAERYRLLMSIIPCVLFPIVILSSMTASSRWIILRLGTI